MKITKEKDGNVYIYNSVGNIEYIITNPNPYLAINPRANTGILISEIPCNQYESQSIKIYTEKVTHVNGVSFTGNRNALLILLSGFFPPNVKTTSSETPEPEGNDDGNNGPSAPGTGFRGNSQESLENTSVKSNKSTKNTNTVAPVIEAKKLTIWQQIKKFFSDIYKKMTS